MRIIGEIPHPVYKITLFKHENKFTVQVENGVFSQQYRLPFQPGLESVDELMKALDARFFDQVTSVFHQMYSGMQHVVSNIRPGLNAEEFDRIL